MPTWSMHWRDPGRGEIEAHAEGLDHVRRSAEARDRPIPVLGHLEPRAGHDERGRRGDVERAGRVAARPGGVDEHLAVRAGERRPDVAPGPDPHGLEPHDLRQPDQLLDGLPLHPKGGEEGRDLDGGGGPGHQGLHRGGRLEPREVAPLHQRSDRFHDDGTGHGSLPPYSDPPAPRKLATTSWTSSNRKGLVITRSTPCVCSSSACDLDSPAGHEHDRHLGPGRLHGLRHLPAGHAGHRQVGHHQVERRSRGSGRAPTTPSSATTTSWCCWRRISPSVSRTNGSSSMTSTRTDSTLRRRHPRRHARAARAHGEPDRERRARALGGVHQDLAAVPRHDAVHHGEPEPGSAGSLGREEGLEDPAPDGVGHPHAGVGDDHLHPLARSRGRDADVSAARERVHGVQDQVRQDLAELGGLPVHRRHGAEVQREAGSARPATGTRPAIGRASSRRHHESPGSRRRSGSAGRAGPG